MPSQVRLCLNAVVFGGLALLLSAFVRHEEPASLPANPVYGLDITLGPGKSREQIGQEKACIYMLVRNFELHEALGSIRQLEDRFNKRFKYPWVFLNDDEFTDEFRLYTSNMVSGQAYYGHIPAQNWTTPDHIDPEKYDACIQDYIDRKIIYGESRSYRNMCRFNSGQFFRHPLLDPYDWYWRVEPGVEYYCDQLYDPFTFLRENDKVYGFVITMRDFYETMPTLGETVDRFFTEVHPEYVAPDNVISFVKDFSKLRNEDYVPDTNGTSNNLCHFWSNFEIGSLNFFRDQKYLDYFDYLDQSGGFYYERWGDAPVHSNALYYMANKSQIHFFSDIGYYHIPHFRAPKDVESYIEGRCWTQRNRDHDVDFQSFSCLPYWFQHAGRQSMFKFSGLA